MRVLIKDYGIIRAIDNNGDAGGNRDYLYTVVR